MNVSAVQYTTLLLGYPFLALISTIAVYMNREVRRAATGKLPRNRELVPLDDPLVYRDEETWTVAHRAALRWLWMYWVIIGAGVVGLAFTALGTFHPTAILWIPLSCGAACWFVTVILTYIGARAARNNLDNRSADN